MIVDCAVCGAQNFVGEERMKSAGTHPPVCWICGSHLPLCGETREGNMESNNCYKQKKGTGKENGKN